MQYKIQLDVYGGEFIVGSLPNKTINYWLTQEQESLDNHLVFDNQGKVPSKYNIYPWHDLGNLIHTTGVDIMSANNRLSILDANTDEVIFESDLDKQWIHDNAWVINDKHFELPDDHGLIHIASIEKGSWEYETLTLDHSIDAKRLQFHLYNIDGIFVIDHMKYDDTEILACDCTTRGKEFRVWFD